MKIEFYPEKKLKKEISEIVGKYLEGSILFLPKIIRRE